MYVPSSFAATDLRQLHDFIEQHSFGTLVSHDGSESSASHLPLLLERNLGAQGGLLGHMARANPQWKQLADSPVLAMFTGPHAYVSPSWFESKQVVPTWNYVAVHVYGTFRLDDSRDRRLEIVRRYVEYYEATMDEPWSLESAGSDFIDGLLDAIVGFRIEIDRIEGKWKLNQNRGRADLDGAVENLKALNTPRASAVAAEMEKVN